MKSESKEDIFEKEFGYSLGVNGFSAWDENYPLRKTMVDHDQERITARGRWEISDKVNRELLKQVMAVGGDGRECGDSWVGVNLHLLAKGTTRDKAADKGGHTQPPIVPRQLGIHAKEPAVTGCKGRVDRGNKVVAGTGRDVKMILK